MAVVLLGVLVGLALVVAVLDFVLWQARIRRLRRLDRNRNGVRPPLDGGGPTIQQW